MNFKEMMQKDLDNVFFNTNEFAEELDVNGQKVIGILAPLDVDPYKSLESSGRNGVVERLTTLSLRNADMPQRVFISGTVKINGEAWIVKSIEKNGGVTKLLLYAAKGRL